MEPIDYIHKFRMTEEDYEFNREDFLQEFTKDFLDYLYRCPSPVSFSRFQQIVSSYYTKFMAISRLKSTMRPDHIGLTKKFWGYFYAHVILPQREARYPKEHNNILNHHKTRQKLCRP